MKVRSFFMPSPEYIPNTKERRHDKKESGGNTVRELWKSGRMKISERQSRY